MRRALMIGLVIACVSFAAEAARAADAAMRTLPGHVPPAVAHLTPKGALPGAQRLNLAIGLPLRDEKGLTEFITRIYDPASPEYGGCLTPDTFAERFGPTEAQYAALVLFAHQHNLTVTATHGNRLLLDVSASVTDIQRAFHLTLRTYRHPTEPRDFFAPDTEPTVDAQLPIVDVSGLSDYVLPHPKSLRGAVPQPWAKSNPKTGSGSGGTFMGSDFRAAYVPGVTLTGSGQSVGLLEFDGFYQSDIAAYESAAGLPNVPVQTVLLDNFSGTPTTGRNSGDTEVSLDIEMAIAMAPGLQSVVVFEAGPNGLQNDILNAMASSNQIRQLSCSWGWGGGPSTTTDNIFKLMVAQRQSFFDASGDSDAFTPGQVDDPNQQDAPSSCPYITVVGGTTLATTGPGGAWSSETVWNAGGGEGSSGGISTYYPIPAWQLTTSMAANGGSTTFRNSPDVAANADNVYVTYGNGRNETVVGTSCAAPIWAAFTALINQQTALAGRPAVGFLNPAIYALGNSQKYGSTFHDVTTGNNTWSGSPNAFYAASGYDLCTGWGSPAGQHLIDTLAGPPDPLGISPGAGFTAAGPAGGPFSPVSTTFLLTNAGTSQLTWSILDLPSWLIASPTQGVLISSSTTNVAVALTAAANNLNAGTYSANVTFTNWSTQVAQVAPFVLQVGQSLVENGGFETGDFTGWTLSGDTTIDTPSGPTVYNGVESATDYPLVVHSGNYGAFLGDDQLATLSQTLATDPGRAYLLSFWLDNPTNGPQQTFLVDWVVNGAATETLYAITNPPAFPWTNLQFIVTAGDSDSVLRFDAENVPYGFGLDDIGLTPIPALTFETVSATAGTLSLTWRTASNLSYQVQYKTNVLQAQWNNLGATVTGTGGSATISDATGGNSAQRFYRLAVSP